MSPSTLPPDSLRHQQEILMVSTLSQQRYCEKKVDLAMQYPKVEPTSPAMEQGTEGHAQLEEGAIPVTREEIETSLALGESLTLFEFPMEGSWEEIPIWGRPDLIRLEGRSATLLVEFKFSRRSNLFPSQQTQTNLYGWLLQQNQFDIRALLCAVAIFPATPPHIQLLPADLTGEIINAAEKLRGKVRSDRRSRFSAGKSRSPFISSPSARSSRSKISDGRPLTGRGRGSPNRAARSTNAESAGSTPNRSAIRRCPLSHDDPFQPFWPST
ncbi:MAG: hypothetical protein MPW15_09705 [Candidatus Manganitrophus sp.]|nr:hypothetical protein [Candidatus Manganitrophus sp.]